MTLAELVSMMDVAPNDEIHMAIIARSALKAGLVDQGTHNAAMYQMGLTADYFADGPPKELKKPIYRVFKISNCGSASERCVVYCGPCETKAHAAYYKHKGIVQDLGGISTDAEIEKFTDAVV